MAFGTHHAYMRSSQFKGSVAMRKCGRLPGCCDVTVLASSAFGAGMRIVFQMATDASHRRAFVFAIRVTKNALNTNMRTCQLEGSQVVIKTGRLPGRRRMTDVAGRTHRTLMDVFAKVAGNTS
jgi:hypothetical protein